MLWWLLGGFCGALGGCLLAPSRVLWVVARGFLECYGWLLRGS